MVIYIKDPTNLGVINLNLYYLVFEIACDSSFFMPWKIIYELNEIWWSVK